MTFRIAWGLGGLCMGGIAFICFTNNLSPFGWGALIVACLMASEALMGDDQ